MICNLLYYKALPLYLYLDDIMCSYLKFKQYSVGISEIIVIVQR